MSRRRLIATAIALLILTAGAVAPAQQEQDVLGVWFDAGARSDRITTDVPFESVMLYLVLQNPSDIGGVSGWECRVDLRTSATLPPVAWTLSGFALNLDTPPVFQVGLGLPLPWAPSIVLASGPLLVPDPDDEVEIRVFFHDPSSLAADDYPVLQPLYASGADPNLLIPLKPSSGCEDIPTAIINDDGNLTQGSLAVSRPTIRMVPALPGHVSVDTFRVKYEGEVATTLEAILPPGPFRMRLGHGAWSQRVSARLLPGSVLRFTVMFVEDIVGDYEATVDLRSCGAPPPVVNIEAAVGGPAVCAVEPILVDFGNVIAGEQAVRTFTVTNNGGTPLVLDPKCIYRQFEVTRDSLAVLPGESHEFTVTYMGSLSPGEFECPIDLADITCSPLTARARTVSRDEMGIFFDEAGTSPCLADPTPPSVDAYLVLFQNGSTSGVAGWEARIGWAPLENLTLSGVELLGTNATNVLTAPEFLVGMSTPIPWQAAIPVAHLTFSLGAVDTTHLYLRPITTYAPAVQGHPSYLDGSVTSAVVPLGWAHGSVDLPAAALVDCEAVVPVMGGVPVALARPGGGVNLAWRYDPAAGDGCHVYRRLDGEGERRLTATPLSPPDGRVEFYDPASDVTALSSLSYQFALLRDGQEIGRSATVKLEAKGAVPQAVVLHPCSPNPFNPQTNIDFELPSSGRARVEIYDVAGRLLRVLLDESLPAGRHRTAWNGRDGGGRQAPSGVYYVRVVAARETAMRSVTLLK